MRRGTTLVEALVAVIITAILVVTVGTVMSAGTQMSVNAKKEMALKQDASITLDFVERHVREKSNSTLQINGTYDKLTLDPAGTQTYFQKVGADLVYWDGSQTITLLDGTVQSAIFSVVSGQRAGQYLLSFNLHLTKGTADVQMTGLTKLRN